MKRILLFSNILVLIFLTGCISSSPGKKYFQLHIDDIPRGNQEQTEVEEPDKIILVEIAKVEDVYNDYRIVYRTSPYQLNYYSYNFWIKRPGKIIRDAMYTYLLKANIFKKVILHLAEGEPDYLLKTKVDVLEEYDLKRVWYAHLKMEIEIKDFKSGKTIIFYRFDKRKRLSERRVERVPVAISAILKEELAAVSAQFLAKIGQQTGSDMP
ncbi:MAG: membrane integrity-associated transporter subunit PqiC [Candidatus Aminicenantes bacterium]|nr:membrane integrity-associated transporter subunit PqiC [Candidatus Aminicenantes bacterium]